MRIWQTIKRSPWPLRIIYFVVAVYLAFVLIAALVWFEFGRDAEHQVVDLGWDLTTMVGIVVFPVVLLMESTVNTGVQNDQVDSCCWLRLSRRNFGTSNNASANSS